MNPYANEELMWQRLKDIQLEAENSRLWATHGVPATVRLLQLLGERVWWLAGLAMRRPPRRRPVRVLVAEDGDAASDAA